MSTASLVAAIGSGGLVDFTLGLVGGGGSILATPLLLYVVGVSNPHVAIGTSVVAVSVNAFANLIAHAQKATSGGAARSSSRLSAPRALLGSTSGLFVDGQHLLLVFGFLMVVVGMLMLRSRTDATTMLRPVDLRMCLITGLAAMIAGAASGFFGIGGGFLIVPMLMLATGMPMISAIGSSLLAVGTFGIATALNYASSGLVDWPLAAEFVVGGIFGGLFGMLAATKLSTGKNVLNRVFGTLILIVAAYVIYRNWPAVTT